MQDLKSFRVFLKVAQLRSFAGAARDLAMTPASVTRIVARLEEALGQQLLVRTTRQVALTTAGALVAARYRPILAAFDEATRDVTQSTRPDRGQLSINAPMSMGLRLLPDLVTGFRLRYPDIALNITLTDTLVDIVQENCDLAIRISGPPADKSTIWRKICEVPRRAVAAPALFDRIPRPQTPDELERAACLSYAPDAQPETWEFRRNGLKRQVTAGSHVISNNGDFLYSLVRSGAGIAVLPDFIIAGDLANGIVEQVLPDWETPALWLTLFYPPYTALPPLVATFTEYCEAHLRDITALSFGTAP